MKPEGIARLKRRNGSEAKGKRENKVNENEWSQSREKWDEP